MAERYEIKIESLETELAKYKEMDRKAAMVTPIEKAIISEFKKRTGSINIYLTKYYLDKDEKSFLLAFGSGRVINWGTDYTSPSKCGKNHPARFPINYTEADIDRIVNFLIDGLISVLQSKFSYSMYNGKPDIDCLIWDAERAGMPLRKYVRSRKIIKDQLTYDNRFYCDDIEAATDFVEKLFEEGKLKNNFLEIV